MRPLEEWDDTYVEQTIRAAGESAWLEKKASDKFALTTKGQPTDETKVELAKQVSAFANAGQGFLVYGIDKHNAYDGGVPETVGRQPINEWVEQRIPSLVHPPITQCSAQMIRMPSHVANRGLLVVSIPLSERRPHWLAGDHSQTAYIRAGAHSLPMSLQTLLDISSRGSASQVEVGKFLDVERRAPQGIAETEHYKYEQRIAFRPTVRLVAGPVCQLWAVDFRIVSGSGRIALPGAPSRNYDQRSVYVAGTDPLFPGRNTPVGEDRFDLTIKPPHDDLKLRVTVYAGSAQPVSHTYSLSDLVGKTIRPSSAEA